MIVGRPPLCGLLVSALSSPVQVSIEDIQRDFGWSEKDTLDLVSAVQTVLDAWDLECEPKIGALGLSEKRIFRCRSIVDPESLVGQDLARGEGPDVEYKESLVLDIKKLAYSGLSLASCFSEEVLFSSLKTIAAFLNTSGGVLLIGVRDDGSVAGLEQEFSIIPGAKKFDVDEWELYLRNRIEGGFVNGRGVSASVLISFARLDGKTIARVQVGQRRDLCVLRSSGKEFLFIRNGNRTLSIQFSDLESFFELRKQYI